MVYTNNSTNMYIVKHRKIFYIASILLIGFSFFSVAKWGLNFGIDFKGGTIIEVQYVNNTASNTGATASTTTAINATSNTNTSVLGSTATSTASSTSTTAVTTDVVKGWLSTLNLGEYSVRQAGTDSFIIRTTALEEVQRKQVVATLGGNVKRIDSVGPVLVQELQGKAVWSLVLVLLAIILFITYAFRGVSKPISSWKYGVVAVIALFHDVIIPTGIFAYLGRNGGYEIDALFVTALLVILGFSIHDTIVVFDRTRENLKVLGFGSSSCKKTFEEIVGMSVRQTISRSINTSLTTVLALIALYFYGPVTTENFSLAMILGIVVGTYSSIFIGSPLLVTWQKWQEKKGK
jgi:preprotein translocase subunit SecF